MQVMVRQRVQRMFDGSPLLLAAGLSVLCVPLAMAMTWLLSDRWEAGRLDSSIQRQTTQIASLMTDAESGLDATFSQMRSLTTWVAEEGHTLSAIRDARGGGEANAFLRKIGDSFNLDLIYVVNARGISVASSNAHTAASTVGQDYSDREYFKRALGGFPGYQFAVGRTTHIAGFYMSMPVHQGDKIVGAVGAKLDLPHLQRRINISGGLVSDGYGVVVMSDNPKYLFNLMPDNRIGSLTLHERMLRYARTDFPALPLVSANLPDYPVVMLLDDEPVLVGSRSLGDLDLTLNVVSDFSVVNDIQRQRQGIFVYGTGASILLVWGLWVAALYFLRARDYRRRLEAANLQLSHLNDELQEQATHDYLTGALNRRAFSALLSTELERVKRYGGELSLGIIDIDHFKRVNDSRGHAVGDIALKFLVDSINRHLRRTDVLARLGGEEFALLMPNTPLGEAQQVIDRMRQTISDMVVPGQEPPLSITFSGGVAGWGPGVSERNLMNAADHALYAAKGSGRNRVLIGQV